MDTKDKQLAVYRLVKRELMQTFDDLIAAKAELASREVYLKEAEEADKNDVGFQPNTARWNNLVENGKERVEHLKTILNEWNQVLDFVVEKGLATKDQEDRPASAS